MRRGQARIMLAMVVVVCLGIAFAGCSMVPGTLDQAEKVLDKTYEAAKEGIATGKTVATSGMKDGQDLWTWVKCLVVDCPAEPTVRP